MYVFNNKLELKNENDGLVIFDKLFAVIDKMVKPYSKNEAIKKAKNEVIKQIEALNIKDEKFIIDIKIGVLHSYSLIYSINKEQHEKIKKMLNNKI